MHDVIHHLTLEKLKNHGACEKALVWFEDNYPIGVYLTKNGVLILIKKLLARKDSFFMAGSLVRETNLCTHLCMVWLLKNIFGIEGTCTNILFSSVSAKEILRNFYKDLNNNIRVTKKRVTR